MTDDPISPDHPKQRLLFFVSQNADESLRRQTKALVLDLANRKSWVNGPPRFVDEWETPSPASGDAAIETLGGYIELYSAVRPWSLKRGVDQAHLEEVEDLVAALQALSLKNAVCVEFELDGKFVGAIENGIPDRLLEEGLLGEWRRNLIQMGR